MDVDVKSALDARRTLGSALRGFRKERGLNTQQLADKLGYSRSTISRTETGEKSMTAVQLQDIILALGIDVQSSKALHILRDKTDEEQWWDNEYFGFLTPTMRKNAGYEAAARKFKILTESMVPGLLQSDKYVELIMAYTFGPDSKLYEKRVKYRIARRRYLAPERGVEFHAVIDSGVLDRCIAHPEVLKDQIEHLITIGSQPNITIQIVPPSAQRVRVMSDRIRMEFGGEINPVVYAEASLISKFSEQSQDVTDTVDLFGTYLAQALTPEDSIVYMRKLLS